MGLLVRNLGALAVSQTDTKIVNIRVSLVMVRLPLQLAEVALTVMDGVAPLAPHDRRRLLRIAIVGPAAPITALTTPSLAALTAREQMHLLPVFQVARSGLGPLITPGVLLVGGSVIPLLFGTAMRGVVWLRSW